MFVTESQHEADKLKHNFCHKFNCRTQDVSKVTVKSILSVHITLVLAESWTWIRFQTICDVTNSSWMWKRMSNCAQTWFYTVTPKPWRNKKRTTVLTGGWLIHLTDLTFVFACFHALWSPDHLVPVTSLISSSDWIPLSFPAFSWGLSAVKDRHNIQQFQPSPPFIFVFTLRSLISLTSFRKVLNSFLVQALLSFFPSFSTPPSSLPSFVKIKWLNLT